MVKTNARPECRPKRHLTAHLGYRLLFLVAIPTVYCLIAAGGRVIEHQNFQRQHTGNQYLPRFVYVLSYFIDIHTNTVIAEPSIIRPAFGPISINLSFSQPLPNMHLNVIFPSPPQNSEWMLPKTFLHLKL
jgi:hypothetical protein